jgi:hypothetical protein
VFLLVQTLQGPVVGSCAAGADRTQSGNAICKIIVVAGASWMIDRIAAASGRATLKLAQLID